MRDRDVEAAAQRVALSSRMGAADRDLSPPAAISRVEAPVGGVSCRLGDASCATAHASVLKKGSARDDRSVLRLQRQFGNQYVQRVLSIWRSGRGNEMEADIGGAIERERPNGRPLDSTTRTRMEESFGAGFSGVRVHHGPQADRLSRALEARAFTTGADIFFRAGEYNPGSSSGRELMAHELTHVVQQGEGEVRMKLEVSQPGDPAEREAEETARAVVQRESQAEISRQPQVPDPDEEKNRLG